MASENPNNLDLNLDGQGQGELDLNFDQAPAGGGDLPGNDAGGLNLSLDLLELHATPEEAGPEPMEGSPEPAPPAIVGLKPNPGRGAKPQAAEKSPQVSAPSSAFFGSEPVTDNNAPTGILQPFPNATSGGWSALQSNPISGVTKSNRFDFSKLKKRLDRLSRPQQFILVLFITMCGGFLVLDPDSELLRELSLPTLGDLLPASEETAESEGVEEAPEVAAVEAKMAKRKKELDRKAEEKLTGNTQDVVIWQENPYWALANGLDGDLKQPQQPWTPEEEQGWRSALTAAELWPKYRTLFQVRSLGLQGSQMILNELALSEKFWLRTMALMALADFGEKIAFTRVENAMQGVPSELFARFVSRFEDASTAGERYILREMIRIADARGRKAILQAIIAKPDKYTPLYLVAGTFDPNEKVERYASTTLRQKKLAQIYDFQDIVRGVKSFDDYSQGSYNNSSSVSQANGTMENAVNSSEDQTQGAAASATQGKKSGSPEVSSLVEDSQQESSNEVEKDSAGEQTSTRVEGGAPLRESGAPLRESADGQGTRSSEKE